MLALIQNPARNYWRFRWHGLALACVCAATGWSFLSTTPGVFHATAKVFVSAEALSRLPTSVSGDSLRFLPQSEQFRAALVPRNSLARIASEAGAQTEGSGEPHVDPEMRDLQKRIEISDDKRSPGIYDVSFRSSDSAESLQVVEELILELTRNLSAAGFEESSQAERSLTQQIAASEKRLKMAEQRASEFAMLHPAIASGEQSDDSTALAGAIEEVVALKSLLADAQRRQEELRERISKEVVAGTADAESASASSAEENLLDVRIIELEMRLKNLPQNLAADHPELVMIRNELDELRTQRELQLVSSGFTQLEARRIPLGASASYRDLFKLASQAEQETALLRQQIAAQTARVDELKNFVGASAALEIQFRALKGQLDSVRSEHSELLDRRKEVRSTAYDERESDFRIIRAPTVDVKSVSADRMQRVIWVLAASLGAGAGLTFLLTLRYPVFYHSLQVEEATGLPVVGVITHVHGKRVQRQFRRELLAYSVGLVILLMGFAAVLVSQRHLFET